MTTLLTNLTDPLFLKLIALSPIKFVNLQIESLRLKAQLLAPSIDALTTYKNLAGQG